MKEEFCQTKKEWKKDQSLTWTTEKRIVKDLVPYDRNPRTMTKEMAEKLEVSLRKFNLAEIPAINQDNTIIAGHQRIAVLMKLGRGDEEIDVRVPSRLLEEKELQEYNIGSNKISGDWDFDILANFDSETLEDGGFDLDEIEDKIDNVVEKAICPTCGYKVKASKIKKDEET